MLGSHRQDAPSDPVESTRVNAAEESSWWDHIAKSSERIEANVYSGLNLEDCLDAITSQIDMAGWVLELGCGPGRLTRTLAAEFPKAHLVGVDSSPLMIDLAAQLEPKMRWVLNNGRDLTDLAGNMFDAAYTMTTFQHIPHQAQARYLSELHRVVKPGGKLRLQYVTKGEAGPMSHPTTVRQMLAFAGLAGWRDVKLDLGLIYPEWAWLTLVNL